MHQKAKRISLLIRKQVQGNITSEECIELEEFIHRSKENEELFLLLTSEEGFQSLLREQKEGETLWADKYFQFPNATEIDYNKPRSYRYFRYAAAAAILLLLIGSVYYYFVPSRSISRQKDIATKQGVPEALPGGRRAVLTLADHSTIMLDSSATGTIAQQGNISINKSENGTIQYIGSGENLNTGLNTLETPNGGDYVLLLEDGSRCIMNAGSRLRYPAAFTGKERKVFLSGEAYFEVAKNARKPFLVETENGTVIRVTGTKFNINAYGNEPFERTSLIEGAVIVTTKTNERKLLPGDQATVSKSGNKLTVGQADVNASIYWTKDYFYFSRATMREVMRQLARWYDLDVEFVGNVGDDAQIQGGFSRKIALSKVLEILKKYEPNLEYAMEKEKVLRIYRKN